MKLFKRGAAVAGGILLLLGLVFLVAATLLPRPLADQRQAERWAGESALRFRQFTALLAAGQTLEPDDILKFRQTAAEKIEKADLDIAAERALCDAWSQGGTLKVSGPRGSFDAAALAVGGRFFDFHPYALRSGGYLSESDLMKDRVVLDEQLAWMLYGSKDLAGLTVRIGERDFVVSGVVAQADDRFSRAVTALGPTVYLDDSARSLLSAGGAVCYEAVLPEPVKGFARGIMTDSFGKLGPVTENTDRFSFANSLRRLRSIGTLGTRTEAVAYPGWENAAVCAETWCALLRGLGLACLIWPAVMLLVLLHRLRSGGVKEAKRLWAAGKERLLDLRDRRRARSMARSEKS